MVDIILMAALADGTLCDATLDRIAGTLQRHARFDGLEWEWVVQRSQELALDAPLFSDARAALVRSLADPASRRLGISLAAKIVSAERPLAEEERAILYSLAEAFDIPEPELDELLKPWAEEERVEGYLRSRYNDPNDPQAPSLFDAMARTDSDSELRLLMYKLCAARRLADSVADEGTLAGVGENIRVGPREYRVDAMIDLETGGRYVVRFLAEGEALYPAERAILSTLQARMNEESLLVIAHQGTISGPDTAFLRGLDQTKLRIERIEI